MEHEQLLFARDPGSRFQSQNNQLEQALIDGEFHENKLFSLVVISGSVQRK